MSSEETPQEDRTEEATERKKSSFRERGQVAKSKELASAVMLSASAAALWFLSEPVALKQAKLASRLFERLEDFELFARDPSRFLLGALGPLLGALAGVMALFAVAAVLAHVGQTGPLFSTKTFELDLKKFDPISGIKRLFLSKDTVVNLLREILKMALLAGVVAWALADVIAVAPQLVQYDLVTFCRTLRLAAFKPMLAAAAVMLLLGALDFLWQRHRLGERMKMSKEELKREMKQSDGDPMIAARRKARHREMVQVNRMLAEVDTASVIVNNPNHYSVALRYRPSDGAPVVIAKGQDALALRIRERARQHDVPMVTNVPLARALYAGCALDQVIPEAFFKAVAEILARLWSSSA